MAAGADGEETFAEEFGKILELVVQAMYKGIGGERVPVGAYRSTSTAAKEKNERVVLERDSGPTGGEKRARERWQR